MFPSEQSTQSPPKAKVPGTKVAGENGRARQNCSNKERSLNVRGRKNSGEGKWQAAVASANNSPKGQRGAGLGGITIFISEPHTAGTQVMVYLHVQLLAVCPYSLETVVRLLAEVQKKVFYI